MDELDVDYLYTEFYYELCLKAYIVTLSLTLSLQHISSIVSVEELARTPAWIQSQVAYTYRKVHYHLIMKPKRESR